MKYWQPSTSWRLCQSVVVLLLQNTYSLQQVADYVSGCSTSTKYWQPSTSCLLGQRLFFYDTLTAFSKLKNMSEVVLLLQNTTSLQQVTDYVTDCSTSMKYWQLSTAKDYVRSCSTSKKYWHPSISWRLCQMLFYFYKILTDFNKLQIRSEVALPLWNTDIPQQVEDYVRGCSTSTKYWQPSTIWRLCQRLFYFYKILTSFN